MRTGPAVHSHPRPSCAFYCDGATCTMKRRRGLRKGLAVHSLTPSPAWAFQHVLPSSRRAQPREDPIRHHTEH